MKRLYLNENMIGDLGAEALAEGLRYNKLLQTLDLTGNRTVIGVPQLCQQLLRANKTLEKPILVRNMVTADGGKALASTLEKSFLKLLSL